MFQVRTNDELVVDAASGGRTSYRNAGETLRQGAELSLDSKLGAGFNARVAATLLNVNLVLSGVASLRFDGRIIAMQLLLLLAWRVAGYLGLGTLARRWWRHGGHGRGPLPGAV